MKSAIDFADDKIESKACEALGYCFYLSLLGLFHFAFGFTNCLFHNSVHPVLSSPVIREDRANVSVRLNPVRLKEPQEISFFSIDYWDRVVSW